MAILTLIKNNHKIRLTFSGTPLLRQVLEKAGYAFFSPCGGKGTCGKCKVRLSGAVCEPNSAERAAGSRLACQAVLLGDATAELPQSEENFAHIETDRAPCPAFTPSMNGCGAAVDIGTTTVVMKLFSKDGVCIGESAALNPQRSVAADVIGRIDAALHGKAEFLKTQIIYLLQTLLEKVCEQAGILPKDVKNIVFTGNTAMLYLLTGHAADSIARAPFKADTLFGEWAEHSGIRVYLPPCMNAFVGADITCAVLASGMTDKEYSTLLCDIGTNGEIALWKDKKLYITSTAAGPAFEGAEISCGCGSIPGAVDRVWAVNGTVYAHTIGGMPAVGLCGSGLVDAIAAFLETGAIDETGALATDSLHLTANGNTITLTQGDIRAVQLSKAAIAAGIEILLKHSSTAIEEIKTLYLAGGFGNHLSMKSAARIGLIPTCLAERAVPIGNAALSGAILLLFDEKQIIRAKQIAANVSHIELGGNTDFNDAFVEHMLF